MNSSLSTASRISLSTRTVARIVVVVVAAIIFILFNASFRSERAPLQNDFDSWLQSTKKTIATSIETAPPIVVALRSERPEFAADWSMSLAAGTDPERLMRLLDLAREANIFSKATSREEKPLRLSVTDGSREFVATLSPSDITNDVATGNLIRLFQLYAVEMPEATTQIAKLDESGGSHGESDLAPLKK